MADKSDNDKSTPGQAEYTPNPFDNSRPLDVHRWSDYREVGTVVEELYGELLGLPEFSGNEKLNKRHLRVVLMDLLHCYENDPEAYIGYARNANKYSGPERYNKLHIKYRPLIRVIDGLTALGYIEGVKGFRDPRSGVSRQARMRATPKLITKLKSRHHITGSMVTRHEGEEVIILKDKEGKEDLGYKETPKIRKMRALVERYNKALARTYIDVTLKGYSGTEPLRIDLNHTRVRRIFNNASLTQGGRFHGSWWQYVPRELRKRITIQGKPTVEIDYSGMHIVILYAKEGIDYFDAAIGDPYEIPGFSNDEKHRNLFKLMLLTVLNCKSPEEARRAVQWEINKNKDDFPVGVNLTAAIAAFEVKHADIRKYFYSGIGIKLQYYDSLVVEQVVDYFIREGSLGIPPLIIHDSFIVRRELADELEQVMNEALIDVLKNKVGGKAATITPKLKNKMWSIHDRDPSASTDKGLIEALQEYKDSDLSDPEQAHRRSEFEETKRYPVAVYRPPEEDQDKG